jgi:hypothetical protein
MLLSMRSTASRDGHVLSMREELRAKTEFYNFYQFECCMIVETDDELIWSVLIDCTVFVRPTGS